MVVGPVVVPGLFLFLSLGGFFGGGGAPKFAYSRSWLDQIAGCLGSGQLRYGLPPNAPCMKRCQIVAGNVPPATVIPCTLFISICAFG